MLTESAAKIKKCKFVRSAVGEANVVAEMRRLKSTLGGEGNGGVIDARVPSFGRDALTGVAHIVALVASAKKPLSYWVESLPQFTMIKLARKGVGPEGIAAASEDAKRLIPGAVVDTRDGIHISGKFNGSPVWLHLRSSNTEPVVRLIAEAPDKKNLDALLAGVKL
jgi:phosphomannomutase